MISTCTMTPCGLLLLAFLHHSQVIPSRAEVCFKKFYHSDGACKQCPNHCERCINATQCTSCQMGYYGQICENKCEVGCTGTCHKVYGHCTYGCLDGEYADLKSLSCVVCSNKCKVCRSLLSCVECSPGNYGEACLNQCAGHCKGRLCNATDGTCFDCDDGFYKVDRYCIACPDGCAQCKDSYTCTVCSDGFIGPIHGRCFLECPAINEHQIYTACDTGLCQSLPAYWKLPVSECHQAILHSSDCFSEGVCTTAKIKLNLELNSHEDLYHSPFYKTFKCFFKCPEHATWDMCVLEEPADNILEIEQNYRMGDKLLAETWVKSHCTKGRPYVSQETTCKTNYFIGIVIYLPIVIVIIAILVFRRKRRLFVPKKKEFIEVDVFQFDGENPTIPLSTKDEDVFNVSPEDLAKKSMTI